MPLTARTLAIPDVLLLEPEVHEDLRGHFFEAWNQSEFDAVVGGNWVFVQDNQSRSSRGVIRGLHYQLPSPQGKLVRVVAGEAFVVVVDIRRSSDRFGAWTSAILSADNLRQLWMPPGLAHGFMAMAEPTDMIYKVTAHYAPGCDRSIRWNDPDVAIDWPDPGVEPVLSRRDELAPLLADAEVFD